MYGFSIHGNMQRKIKTDLEVGQ